MKRVRIERDDDGNLVPIYDETNVVVFEPRRREEPTLRYVEIRLDEACGIQMTVYDDAGNVVILEYALASKPDDFDLDRLRRAWDEWRDSSEIAS